MFGPVLGRVVVYGSQNIYIYIYIYKYIYIYCFTLKSSCLGQFLGELSFTAAKIYIYILFHFKEFMFGPVLGRVVVYGCQNIYILFHFKEFMFGPVLERVVVYGCQNIYIYIVSL